MRVNIHVPWNVRRSPEGAEKSVARYFTLSLIEAFQRKPEVELTVSARPLKAHEIGDAAYCINHHQCFGRRRNLNVKVAYLPHYFYADRSGYSGWSEIGQKEFTPGDISAQHAQRYFQEKIDAPYLRKGLSKYPQQQAEMTLPKDYVLVPLQVPGDAVLKLAWFSQDDLLRAICDLAHQHPVVIKIHPYSRRDHPDHVAKVEALHNPVRGIYVVDGHIHTLIQGARAVVCTNSGVGLEGVLHAKPVITCGTCDYHHLTRQARTPSDIADLLEGSTPLDPTLVHRYATWFFGRQLIDIRDNPKIWTQKIWDRLLRS